MIDPVKSQKRDVATLTEIVVDLVRQGLLLVDREDRRGVQKLGWARDLAARFLPDRNAFLVPGGCLVILASGDDEHVLMGERYHIGRSLLPCNDQSTGKSVGVFCHKPE